MADRRASSRPSPLGDRAIRLLAELIEQGCITYDPIQKVERCHYCHAPFVHRLVYHRDDCPFQAAAAFFNTPEMLARIYEHDRKRAGSGAER